MFVKIFQHNTKSYLIHTKIYIALHSVKRGTVLFAMKEYDKMVKW